MVHPIKTCLYIVNICLFLNIYKLEMWILEIAPIAIYIWLYFNILVGRTSIMKESVIRFKDTREEDRS